MEVNLEQINNTIGKMSYYLGSHESICVGVSGGSDSNIIVHMIATYFREYLPKVHFVFCNTGLEYKATIKHLDYLEKRYDIKIDRIRGIGVVTASRKNGMPIISKDFSSLIEYALKGKEWALKKIKRTRDESPYALSLNKKKLCDFLLENHILISNSCCRLSKKNPYKRYLTSKKADLTISGERKCEGGVRATAVKDCFVKEERIDKYMPLFFWDDETKQYYKESEGILYSDCYEVWGMKRTGCTGCPFNSKMGEDLTMIKTYEPNLYKACMNIFGFSYFLMDFFNIRKIKILDDDRDFEYIEKYKNLMNQYIKNKEIEENE